MPAAVMRRQVAAASQAVLGVAVFLAIIGCNSGAAQTASSPKSDGPWRPPAQAMPSDPGYRELLGAYAQLVLGSAALVPQGSPEHLAYLKACLESAGFAVSIDGGGITARVGEQEGNYRDVTAKCEQAAVDGGLVKAAEPLDDSALQAQYDAFMLTYECMRSHDYPVSDPPSKDTYVGGRGQGWHPYDLVGASNSLPEIEKDCPADLVVLFEMLANRHPES